MLLNSLDFSKLEEIFKSCEYDDRHSINNKQNGKQIKQQPRNNG